MNSIKKSRRNSAINIPKKTELLIIRMFFGPFKPEWYNENGVLDNTVGTISNRVGLTYNVTYRYITKHLKQVEQFKNQEFIMPSLMNTQNEKVKSLSEDIDEAIKFALENKIDDDGGTCNFDSVVIKLPRWKKTEIEDLNRLSNGRLSETLSGLWNNYRFININAQGQANMRTKMVEDAKKYLQEKGWDVAVYYQMD